MKLLKVPLSLSNFASSGPLSPNRGVPAGPSTMILGPDSDLPQASSLSQLLSRQWQQHTKNERDGHCTWLSLCGHRSQSLAEATSHLREEATEESPLWFPIGLLCLESSLWWIQLLDRRQSCFCFKELVLRTQWQNLPDFQSPVFTDWHFVLQICLPGRGCHPPQQQSLTHSPTKETDKAQHPPTHANTAVSSCAGGESTCQGALMTWPRFHTQYSLAKKWKRLFWILPTHKSFLRSSYQKSSRDRERPCLPRLNSANSERTEFCPLGRGPHISTHFKF